MCYVTHPRLTKTVLLYHVLAWLRRYDIKRDFQPNIAKPKQIGAENQDIHQRHHTNRLWRPHYRQIHAHAALKSELFTAVCVKTSLNSWSLPCQKSIWQEIKPQIGPQSKATVYEQYSLKTKQHSHSYLYISKEHHNKRLSVVYCSLPCSGASQASQEMNFGVIQRLYQHSFAEKSFMWAAVSLYMEPCYDASCGLWRAENKTEKRILVLLRSISRPLTVAHDSNIIWFLDVYPWLPMDHTYTGWSFKG